MEKMTEMETLCDYIVLELIKIKMHICNDRDFEGGMGLGGLINSLLYRKDTAEAKRKNEKVQEEDCEEECEDGEEEEDYKTMYTEKCEEFVELRENMIDFRQENKKLNRQTKESFTLLKDLYNHDHIFPDHRGLVRQFLMGTGEFMDGCNGRITDKI